MPLEEEDARDERRGAQALSALRRRDHAWRGAAAALLLCGGVTAFAADDPRVQVEQKLRLAAQLLADSPALQRISGSGNPQALAHLDEGRVHHALASEALVRGDFAGARREADEALRKLGLARRLVPDAAARHAAARQRYEQLSGGIERLIGAWRARTEAQPSADTGDLTAAVGLVATARQLAQEGRHEEANQNLLQAQGHVLAGMNRLLHATTLDYTLRPTHPAEEFEQELARHGGFADLLPLAMRELAPRADALKLLERYAETSRSLRAQALQQMRAGHAEAALDHIRNATLYVQRALLAAGLATPPATGNPP
jgi:hypothetical protein